MRLLRPETDKTISIHAPREGSDTPGGLTPDVSPLSQSTLPARGATKGGKLFYIPGVISIHAPREGSDTRSQKGASM